MLRNMPARVLRERGVFANAWPHESRGANVIRARARNQFRHRLKPAATHAKPAVQAFLREFNVMVEFQMREEVDPCSFIALIDRAAHGASR